jgi:hypothetical protein
MERINDGEGRYRVLLLGIEITLKRKETPFAGKFPKSTASFSLLEKITKRCPTVLKKSDTR